MKKGMRYFKVISLLIYTLVMAGCSKESVGQSWIPQKDISPSPEADIKEETENQEVKKQKTGEAVTFHLTDTVKAGERLFCSLKEVKQTIGERQNENTRIHMNTYFIDENGLLCIGVDVMFDFQENQCTLQKQYYLPDKSVFTEQEFLDMNEKWTEENETFYVDIAFLSEVFLWDYDTNRKNQVVVRDQNITLEENTSVVYEPMVFDTVAGKYWSITGSIQEYNFGSNDNDIFYCCTKPEAYVEVTEGEQLRFNFYCSWLPEVASILFLDDNDKVIQFYSYMQSTTLTDQIVKVPTGATKMHLSFFKGQRYQIDKVSYVTGVDLEEIDLEWYEQQCEKKLKENQELSWKNITQKPLDKAYITFVLDDCRSDMDQVADIFEKYDMPLCISAIYNHLWNSASQGAESRLEVCRRVEKNGGEILCHSAEVMTQEKLQDFSTKYRHFYKEKKYLQAFGFDVQGIILAGGEGQVAGSQESDAWIRTFFDYSDLYGMEEKGEPYYHGRTWLGNYWDSYEEVIQKTVKEKKWVSFYFHGLSEVNQEMLEGILQYVSQIPQEELEVTNYRTIYEKYYK